MKQGRSFLIQKGVRTIEAKKRRMLLGLINPTDGKAFVLGKDIQKEKKKILSHIGASIETPGFYANLTGRENLQIFSEYSGRKDSAEIKNVLEHNELKKFKNQRMTRVLVLLATIIPIADALLCLKQHLVYKNLIGLNILFGNFLVMPCLAIVLTINGTIV